MDILMPQLGETVTEGKIIVWFKAVGDKVTAGDNLFEIETDKVSMEVPATSAGVLSEIRVVAGEIAPVGAVVAVVGEAAVGHAAPEAAKPAAVAQMDPWREVRTPDRNYGPARLPSGVSVSPLARRKAVEAGVDLDKVRGSGPGGRIVAGDIGAAREKVVVEFVEKAPATLAPPLNSMRRTIASRLSEAWQSVPHFYLKMDVDLDRLLALREEANAAGEVRLSLNDFLIKAHALALQKVPAANASWAGDSIRQFQASDVGVAVAIEGGLLTPVIRKAEAKSVTAISIEMKDLAARAKARKLRPEEYQGGSTSISNLGMLGVREFSAIINPPQATILAIGAAERRPVEAEGGGVRFVTRLTVTLSCDHRVVDGVLGAQLLGAFRKLVENPIALFL